MWLLLSTSTMGYTKALKLSTLPVMGSSMLSNTLAIEGLSRPSGLPNPDNMPCYFHQILCFLLHESCPGGLLR